MLANSFAEDAKRAGMPSSDEGRKETRELYKAHPYVDGVKSKTFNEGSRGR